MTINPTPRVSCRYGAPMGRHTGPEPGSLGDRWRLRRIPLDSGGYDPGGAYWGHGLPLYWARNQDEAETFFRADSRNAAKARIRRDYDPEARFYR